MKGIISVAALCVLLVAGCGGPAAERAAGETAGPSDGGTAASEAAGQREVTVMLDWTPNTNHSGLYLAEANGWYDEAGLDVRIVQPGEQGGLPAVASGDADFAISVQEALSAARSRGAPVVSVAAILAENTTSLTAPAEEGIRRPRDLEGHRYGGFGGDLEIELIHALMECDGADPDTVEIVEVGNVDYRAGFERDFFDFVWIFDGWDGIRLQQAGVEVTTLPFADHVDCIPTWYSPLLATSEQRIQDEPEMVRDFMAATARGYEAAIEDPTAAADALLEAAPELDEALVRGSAEYLARYYRADDLPWGYQEEHVWRDFTAFLEQAGMLEGEFVVEDAYTNAFLPTEGASEAPRPEATPSAAASG